MFSPCWTDDSQVRGSFASTDQPLQLPNWHGVRPVLSPLLRCDFPTASMHRAGSFQATILRIIGKFLPFDFSSPFGRGIFIQDVEAITNLVNNLLLSIWQWVSWIHHFHVNAWLTGCGNRGRSRPSTIPSQTRQLSAHRLERK